MNGLRKLGNQNNNLIPVYSQPKKGTISHPFDYSQIKHLKDGETSQGVSLIRGELSVTNSTKAKLSKNFISKLTSKAKHVMRNREPKELLKQSKEICKKVELIEKSYNQRIANEEADQVTEEKRRAKAKQDIFKWMNIPFSSEGNPLLKKMVRVRLLEIMSDVKCF